jgi:hypothetical protein
MILITIHILLGLFPRALFIYVYAYQWRNLLFSEFQPNLTITGIHPGSTDFLSDLL